MAARLLCSFLLPFVIYAIHGETENYATCSQVGDTLPSIIADIQSDVQRKMESTDYIKFLQSTIDESNATFNCQESERLFARFTAQNTFATFFADLCNMVFSYDLDRFEQVDQLEMDETNQMKVVINNHLTEDGSHWLLAYNDFGNLGLNEMKPDVQLNDFFFRHLFGNYTKAHRRAAYQIVAVDAKYDGETDPVVRYVMIMAIEETGKVLFLKFAELYDIYKRECNDYVRLQYLAHLHSRLETGDLVLDGEHSELQDVFDEHVVTNVARKRLLYAVGKQAANAVIENTMNNLYEYQTEYYRQQPFWNLQ